MLGRNLIPCLEHLSLRWWGELASPGVLSQGTMPSAYLYRVGKPLTVAQVTEPQTSILQSQHLLRAGGLGVGRGRIAQYSAASGDHCSPAGIPSYSPAWHPLPVHEEGQERLEERVTGLTWGPIPQIPSSHHVQTLHTIMFLQGRVLLTHTKESSKTRHGLLGGLWLTLRVLLAQDLLSLGQVCATEFHHCPAYPLSPRSPAPLALATCHLFASPVCAPVPEWHHWHCAGHNL